MKKLTIILLAVLAFNFSSCDEDLLKIASMSAEVDGAAWNTVARVTALTGGNFVITGTAADGTFITITIKGDSEGTYSLSLIPMVAEFAASYNEEVTVEGTFVASAGQVVLTSVDKTNKKISGEFYFTGSNLTGSVNVSDGVFEDVKYSEQ